MKTVRKHVLIALAALSLGGTAMAQQTDTQQAQPQRPHLTKEQRQAKMAEFRAKRAEHMAQRQQQLHDALKLSGSQEQAWNSFVASMKPAERAHHDRAAFASLPAPERMQKMIDFSKQRTARMESRLAALNSFYSTLSPEQKKVFDDQTRHFMGGRGGHRGGQHHGGMMRG